MTISFTRGNFTNGGATSRTSITCAFSANAAGSLLVVSIGFADAAGTISANTPTDTAGNTYHAAGTKTRNATQQYSLQTFYAWGAAASASTNTVTVTLSASSTFLFPHIQEYASTNGAWSSDPLDKTASGTGNSTSLLTSSVTPTTNNQLAYTFGGTGGAGTIAAAGSFTLREPAGGGQVTGSADLVQTTATAVQGALSSAPSSGQWGIQLATFKDAASAAVSAAATATGTGTIAAAATLTALAAASLTGTGTRTATASLTAVASASLGGVATITATVAAGTVTVNATLTGVAAISASVPSDTAADLNRALTAFTGTWAKTRVWADWANDGFDL